LTALPTEREAWIERLREAGYDLPARRSRVAGYLTMLATILDGRADQWGVRFEWPGHDPARLANLAAEIRYLAGLHCDHARLNHDGRTCRYCENAIAQADDFADPILVRPEFREPGALASSEAPR
jgi:hypothetical protein